MVPFRGTFDHTLDAKNRLTVPARYRAALADGVVLTRPLDQKPCVGMWRAQEYSSYCERALAALPALSPRLTELQRFFYGDSQDAELDAALASASTGESACYIEVVGGKLDFPASLALAHERLDVMYAND